MPHFFFSNCGTIPNIQTTQRVWWLSVSHTQQRKLPRPLPLEPTCLRLQRPVDVRKGVSWRGDKQPAHQVGAANPSTTAACGPEPYLSLRTTTSREGKRSTFINKRDGRENHVSLLCFGRVWGRDHDCDEFVFTGILSYTSKELGFCLFRLTPSSLLAQHGLWMDGCTMEREINGSRQSIRCSVSKGV